MYIIHKLLSNRDHNSINIYSIHTPHVANPYKSVIYVSCVMEIRINPIQNDISASIFLHLNVGGPAPIIIVIAHMRTPPR